MSLKSAIRDAITITNYSNFHNCYAQCCNEIRCWCWAESVCFVGDRCRLLIRCSSVFSCLSPRAIYADMHTNVDNNVAKLFYPPRKVHVSTKTYWLQTVILRGINSYREFPMLWKNLVFSLVNRKCHWKYRVLMRSLHVSRNPKQVVMLMHRRRTLDLPRITRYQNC